MPPALTGNFPNHLLPGIRQIVGTRLGARESHYNRLYNVETTNRNYEDYLYATGLPIAVEKPQAQDIQSFDPIEGTTKRLTPTVYAIGFEVSEENWEDDLYSSKGSALREASNGLADSLAERVEVEAHRPFLSEGFTGSVFTVLPSAADFFSTSHTPVTGGLGPTQANRPATDVDLTVTSLRAGLTTFRKYKDDQGKRIPGISKPSSLIVPPDLEYDAKEILQSQYRPDMANMVDNVTRGVLGLVVDPYLADDPDEWILQAPKHYAYFLWRKRPTMDSFDDRRARVMIVVGLERFVAKPVSWMGYYASPGA